MSLRQVACPVALHPDGAPLRLPVFAHPLAGLQLVKGGIRAGEHPPAAAARELFEESGLETRAAIAIGQAKDIQDGAVWQFSLCRIAPPVRTQWAHLCADDGGHLLRFHWHALDAADPAEMDPMFCRALAWIRKAL